MGPQFVLECVGCGDDGIYDIRKGIFACPKRQDRAEHVPRKRMEADGDARRALGAEILERWAGRPPFQAPRDSFRIFAPLLGSRQLVSEAVFDAMLDEMDRRLNALEGQGFRVTPADRRPALEKELGWSAPLIVKDETGNIAGSHKGRHLMGTLLYLEALRRGGFRRGGAERGRHGGPERAPRHRGAEPGFHDKPELAIYSCGNAALAAAAVARAGGYRLHAFVPETIAPPVAAMLRERDAVMETIPRSETGGGDPCYLAFHQALTRKGWLPFACSGTDNWSNIEGGQTLGWEMALQARDMGVTLDCLVIQVGGGALARAVWEAMEMLEDIGLLQQPPQMFACQPAGGFPFARAWFLVLAEIAARNGLALDFAYDRNAEPAEQLAALQSFLKTGAASIRRARQFAMRHFSEDAVQSAMAHARRHRNLYMWPWDGPAPESIAHGILDDETYDWYHIMAGLLRTGGAAVVVSEAQLAEAQRLGREKTGIPVSATGSAGLAGLMQLADAGDIPRNAAAGLFFTGVER